MKRSNLFLVVLTALLFTGCADVSPMAEACITDDLYGFWGGLWHGIIAPFSWGVSLFVAVYAYNNNGGWYDTGFIGALLGGATR